MEREETAIRFLLRCRNQVGPTGEEAMANSDRQTLISKGRKAGLQTSELYAALSAGRFPGTDTGRADGNGFVSEVDREGRHVVRPVDASREE